MFDGDIDLIHFNNFEIDPVSKFIINKVLAAGGIIYGGYLRDLIANQKYCDIDIYFPYKSTFTQIIFDCYGLYTHEAIKSFYEKILGDLELYYEVSDLIKFSSAQHKTVYKNRLFAEKYSAIKLPLYSKELYYINIIVPISIQDLLPTADFQFLDFDINTLYLDQDRIIKSTINDVANVVKSIKNRKCKIMRVDVDQDRINHILNKGYACPRLALAE